MRKILCSLILGVLITVGIQAQDIVGRAIMDSSEILIGDQTQMVLEISKPVNAQAQWPIIVDTLDSKISVASRSKFDTVFISQMETIRQSYMITAFDSGDHYIKPFFFVIHNQESTDTIYTSSLSLTVHTIPVDTTKAYNDIKPVLQVPYTFGDFIPWIGLVLGVILIVVVIILLIKKFSKKDSPSFVSKTVSRLPSYVIALKELERIAQEKIWEEGHLKQYYTEITDVLRVYIEERYGVDAKEMTSLEILNALKDKEINKPLLKGLKELLLTSDMVKFAKASTAPEENERSLRQATEFVESTKVETHGLLEDVEADEEVLEEEENYKYKMK